MVSPRTDGRCDNCYPGCNEGGHDDPDASISRAGASRRRGRLQWRGDVGRARAHAAQGYGSHGESDPESFSQPDRRFAGDVHPAQIATALQGVEAAYQSLPHTNLVTDLNTLVTRMVSSGAYRSAVLEPGGIAAKLPDGTPVLIFADCDEDLGGPSASKRPRASAQRGRLDAPLSPPNPHEIAILVNELDNSGAFVPSRQLAYGHAFAQSGFNASSGFGVDAVDVSLQNLLDLGSGHPFDFLNLATHGMVGSDADMPLATNTYYAWLSTTPVSESVVTEFQSDFDAGNLISAIYLTTDAFIFDRMLGEQPPSNTNNTGLSGYANQRMPPQRPFPLDQIDTVMADEDRSSPIQPPQAEYYTDSDVGLGANSMAPPLADGTLARLVVSDFGGESVASPTLLYFQRAGQPADEQHAGISPACAANVTFGGGASRNERVLSA